MLVIDASNAERYLRDAGRIEPADQVEITRLAGGVSNEVLYVAFPRDPSQDFVLKQARERLRVADPWFCGVERIWREVEVLRICQRVLESHVGCISTLPAGGTARLKTFPAKTFLSVRSPRILFEDRENYCFGMEAAPQDHVVWKQRLLHCPSEEDAALDEHIAEQCGRLLGALHGGTWGDPSVAAALDDRRVFDELRLDPYFRTVARRHPDAAPLLDRLAESVWSRRLCLVHADFSPKNLLVYAGGLMMVDFETGHYGDPAFDLGFFLTHLVLKGFYHAPGHEPLFGLTDRFWSAYRETIAALIASGYQREEAVSVIADLERHAILNFAGCAWARLDGKSPVEYLTDGRRRDQVRRLCRGVLKDPPDRWIDVLGRCREVLDEQ